METTYLNNKKALFTECKTPTREPDWIDPDSSRYWKEENHLYRESNNWTNYLSNKEPFLEQYKTGDCGNNQLDFWLNKPIKMSKYGKDCAKQLFDELFEGYYTMEEFNKRLQKLNNGLCFDNTPLCGRVPWEFLHNFD